MNPVPAGPDWFEIIVQILSVIILPATAILFSIMSFFWSQRSQSQQRTIERQQEQIAKRIDRRDEVLYELARQLRLLAKKFQNQFPDVQSPIIVGKLGERPKPKSESEETSQILSTRLVYVKRLDVLLDIFDKMKDLAIELESSGGEDFTKYLDEYDRHLRTISLAINWTFRSLRSRPLDVNNPVDQRESEKHEHILHHIGEGRWLRTSVNETTEEFRRLLSKYTHVDAHTSIAELPKSAKIPVSDADLDAATNRLKESNADVGDNEQEAQNHQAGTQR